MAIDLRDIRAAAGNRPIKPSSLINFVFNQFPTVFPLGIARQEVLVWAAIFEPCVACGADPGEPCLNLLDLTYNRKPPRTVKWPHDQRINWWMLFDTLKKRGFIDERLSMEDATLSPPSRRHQEAAVQRLRRRALDGAADGQD